MMLILQPVLLRKILNYGVELEPTNNFLKTELITSRFRVTNKIQLDIYSAIVSYLSKKPRVIKIKIFNNTRFVVLEDSETLTDVTEPLIYKNNDDGNNLNRYTEYYLFLLDLNINGLYSRFRSLSTITSNSSEPI